MSLQKKTPLFSLENVICTLHLGASTTETQEKVAVQTQNKYQIVYLKGTIRNVLNAPNLSVEKVGQ